LCFLSLFASFFGDIQFFLGQGEMQNLVERDDGGDHRTKQRQVLPLGSTGMVLFSIGLPNLSATAKAICPASMARQPIALEVTITAGCTSIGLTAILLMILMAKGKLWRHLVLLMLKRGLAGFTTVWQK
jgi:hypothetical protein